MIVGGLVKIAAFIVLSPLLGMVLGFLIGVGMTWLFHKSTPRRVDTLFRKGQLLSAALYSLGHGTQRCPKNDGHSRPAVLLEHTSWNGRSMTDIPFWVILICHAAMGLGTLLGGWRIVKTMGSKITKLEPFGGFCAESGAAITLFATTAAGIPVSTTHTIAGSIVGFGAMRRISAVRWGITINIVWAWVLTIPVAACIGAASYLVVSPWRDVSVNRQAGRRVRSGCWGMSAAGGCFCVGRWSFVGVTSPPNAFRYVEHSRDRSLLFHCRPVDVSGA